MAGNFLIKITISKVQNLALCEVCTAKFCNRKIVREFPVLHIQLTTYFNGSNFSCNLFHIMTPRHGICEFKSLAKSVELDTEWFRSVTSILPKFATSGGGSIVPFVSPYSDEPPNGGPISDSGRYR